MIERLKSSPSARTVVCIALIFYCISIILLSWTPTAEITWVEWVAGTLAWAAIFGLIAHATEAIYLPGENYAYLISGWAGFTTMLLYLIDSDDSVGHKASITTMLLTGVIGSYGAYLAQIDYYGGNNGR